MIRLWKRKDRLAEVIIKSSKPIYYTLWQYNQREDQTLKIPMWEKMKIIKNEMDTAKEEHKWLYRLDAYELYKNKNRKE